MKYIIEPKTKEEYLNNVQFQLGNVEGYISIRDYESALIKAESLVHALQEMVKIDKS